MKYLLTRLIAPLLLLQLCITNSHAQSDFDVQIDNIMLSCFGDVSDTIVVQVIGGAPPFQYDWSHLSGENKPAKVEGLNAGYYELILMDSTGLMDTAFFEVDQPSQIEYEGINSSGLVCVGLNNATLSLSGVSGGVPMAFYGYAIDYDFAGTLENDNYNQTYFETFLGASYDSIDSYTGIGLGIDSLYAGTYYATISDANGCSIIDSHIIHPPSMELDLIVPDSQLTCHSLFQDSVFAFIFSGSPTPILPDTLYWSNADTSGFSTHSQYIYNIDTGYYEITVVSQVGCRLVDTVFFTRGIIDIAIDTFIQSGDSVLIFDNWFSKGGYYSFTSPSIDTCDYQVQLFVEELSENCLLVTNAKEHGLGSFKNALDCALDGDTILFRNYLTQQIIPIDIDGIYFFEDVTIIGQAGLSLQPLFDGHMMEVSPGADVNIENLTFHISAGNNVPPIRNLGRLSLKNIQFVDHFEGLNSVEYIRNYGHLFLEGEIYIGH